MSRDFSAARAGSSAGVFSAVYGIGLRRLRALGLGVAVAAIGCTTFMSSPNPPPTIPAHATSPATTILGPDASPVDLARIGRFPEPGWQTPRSVRFSPDGALVTFLQSESQSDEMALFAFDVRARTTRLLVRATDLAAQDPPLSREEELRRERRRSRIAGITDYRWAKRAPVMILPHGGKLYLRDATGALSTLVSGADPVVDAKLSDDGSKVAFVRHGELFSVDVRTKTETQLTRGASEGVTHGLSDYVAQEEFDEESGFWWSPSGDRIAYLEVDERGVLVVPVLGYRSSKPDLMQQRYPRAGTANPSVRLGILDLKTQHTTWITLPRAGEHYLGRFQWSADGNALWFQALTRDQKERSVLRADATTGAARELWTFRSPTWTEFSKLRLLERSPRVLATTEVEGHFHLELRDAETGARVALLTQGAWDVQSIAEVDEARGRVLFVANQAAPLERRLHAVPLAGGPITTLTPERGTHVVAFASDGSAFVDEHSATDRLPKVVVRDASGAEIGALPVPEDPDVQRLAIRPAEIVEVKSPSGETLYGALLKPRKLEPGKRYPTIVMVYGGPGVQMVHDQWSPRLLWQHLADRGFVVFQLDNRGSTGRGPGFQAPIYHHLGKVELEDQLAGLDALAAMPFVDATRVGIYGHSYGGFMTTLAMLGAPGRFKVGVAGAPVTSWALYDTGYTERYMGTPADNAAGYAESDLARLAGKLDGKYLLLHALMDENVHFDNTAHLIDALVAAGKNFDLFVFPGERHGYRDPAARRYAMGRVIDYFVQNL